jgi:uncharacterized protein GlcG (DUF336 family)
MPAAQVIAFALLTTAMSGSSVLIQKNMSLSVARAAAEAALETCRRGGFQVSVTVVDRAAQTRVSLRDDDAKPHTFEASQRKAYTALTFRRPSSELEKEAAGGGAALAAIPGVFMRAGGLPIRAQGEVIGAIGVAGAPGGAADEVCAEAGLDQIAGSLK